MICFTLKDTPFFIHCKTSNMKLKHQTTIIRRLVEQGDLKNALMQLQQLADGSADLNAVLLQSARLSNLQMGLLTGTINYQDQDITRNQITIAILELLINIESDLQEMGTSWQVKLENTLDEIIRKHGISPEIHQIISAHRKVDRTYKCLWIDDNPVNDQMEMQAIMSLGLECRTASNPYEAYTILQREIVDIVITNSLGRLRDYPNEGIDFCRFLSSHKTLGNIPVLLHSVSFQQSLETDNREAIIAALPTNIKNRFSEKNTLVIRDLIEEIVRVVFSDNPTQPKASRSASTAKATPSGGKPFGQNKY